MNYYSKYVVICPEYCSELDLRMYPPSFLLQSVEYCCYFDLFCNGFLFIYGSSVLMNPPSTINMLSEKNNFRFFRCQLGMKFSEIERALLIETIKMYRGNKGLIAKTLGLSQKTVYNKIDQFKLYDYLPPQGSKWPEIKED